MPHTISRKTGPKPKQTHNYTEIYQEYLKGKTYRQLAREYKLSLSTIYRIVQRVHITQ